jgi:hypothetical protein
MFKSFPSGFLSPLIIALALFCKSSGAQSEFKAILLNKNDSTPIAYATVKLIETASYTGANEKGEFKLIVPDSLTLLHLEISMIGYHAVITHKRVQQVTARIYVLPASFPIQGVVIQGFTAKEVVRKAIAAIPKNYSDTSYASISFYRQYQKINNVFENLLEAQLVVLFNLSPSKKGQLCKEAFAVKQLRRSLRDYKVKEYYDDGCVDLFRQNPVYHFSNSSFCPGVIDDCIFSFDTTQVTDYYVINYVKDGLSSENHSITNYDEVELIGESNEYGQLAIDRSSFAIIRYERKAIRNKRFQYPKNNNFLVPDQKYAIEFLEGNLVVEFQPINGKWYMKSLFHEYTNELYRSVTGEKMYTITDAFEWYADTTTRVIPRELVSQFHFNPNLSFGNYKYINTEWMKALPPFHFFKAVDIYEDLSRKGSLESQYEVEGRLFESKGKSRK